jgi:5-methylcytosine-specific restriction endonuclease McrA
MQSMGYSDPEMQKKYNREWYARRRASWFANRSCVDCGAADDLQLDHVDPSQKVSHRVWSWSQARREAELAKCVARCGDCHLKKTLLGRENGNARLTEDQIRGIYRRHKLDGATMRAVAAEFGVSSSTVSNICTGKRWKSLNLADVAQQ